MSDLKDKVSGYLSTFLDKELSEIAVDVRKSFLYQRNDKEAARGRAASDIRKASKAGIAATADRAAKIKDAADVQGGITKPEGGGDTATRHQLKRQAWKHTLATEGPKAHTGATPVKGRRAKDTGRVSTAVTQALRAATDTARDPAKKRVLGLQGQSPNNTMEPDFSIAPAEVGSTKKFVSQEVLADLRKKAAEKK